VSYKLKLPESAKIHLVFHISQLKKAIGNYTVEPELPVGLETEDEDLDEPESLLASRTIREGDLLVKQWLVKWRGRTGEDTSWVDETLLKSQFPYFSLEDKAVIAGEGNDRNLNNGPDVITDMGLGTKKPVTWKVCSRRKKAGTGREVDNGGNNYRSSAGREIDNGEQ
jgi:hypothetical protein